MKPIDFHSHHSLDECENNQKQISILNRQTESSLNNTGLQQKKHSTCTSGKQIIYLLIVYSKTLLLFNFRATNHPRCFKRNSN